MASSCVRKIIRPIAGVPLDVNDTFDSQTEGDDSTKSNWEADWAFYVSRTTDGGRTWSETHVQMPASKTKTPSLSHDGYLTISDRLHGSLMLEHQSGSAFHFGSLLVTSDGGRTWQASDKTAQVLWRNSCSARSVNDIPALHGARAGETCLISFRAD